MMQHRQLGRTGPRVSALGLGCMGLSGSYGPSDRADGIATIHAALEAGVTLLDTGDFYGSGHNELLIADALRGSKRHDAVISLKFGVLRDPQGTFVGYDGRPAAVKNFLAHSLQRLRLDHVDIYRPARLDPAVPVEETVGAIADMVKKGFVRHIGLSEVGSATLRRAVAVHPIADLQIEYSLLSRGIEDDILATCRELGIGITAYGVLGRGLIGGAWRRDGAGPGDLRLTSPRFQKSNLDRNLALAEALRTLAAARGATAAEVAIAWVLSRGEDIVPLVGARKPAQLADALAALALELDGPALAAIEAAVPKGAAAGERYPAPQMRLLDSERR